MGDEVNHIKSLVPDPVNRRKHTPRNVGMIVDALHEVGSGRSIVIDEKNEILAGNATVEAAGEAGITKVRVVETDGNEIIAVRRKDLTEEQKRKLAMYDNRAAELAEWDVEQLAVDASEDVDLSSFFYKEELDSLLQQSDELVEPSKGYTTKVESPVYKPGANKPLVSELYDTSKYQELQAAILESELSDRDKAFLICAAQRHVVFNYSKIADFYAHSDKVVQELMEASALVIIDFHQAIEKGFVKLHKEFQELAHDDTE